MKSKIIKFTKYEINVKIDASEHQLLILMFCLLSHLVISAQSYYKIKNTINFQVLKT